MRNRIGLQWLNFLALIGLLAVNAFAVIAPLNDVSQQELSAMYPNLFVPADFTFSVWSVIFLGLIAFGFYQLSRLFRTEHRRNFLDRIGPWFIISSIFNVSWLFAWHYYYIGASVLVMMGLLVSLIMMYVNLGVGVRRVPLSERLFVFWPLSAYLGWISIALIANIAAYLTAIDWGRFGLAPQLWAAVLIFVAMLLVLAFLHFRRDFVVAIVAIWALAGITYARLGGGPSELTVAYAAAVAIGAIVLYGTVVLSSPAKVSRYWS